MFDNLILLKLIEEAHFSPGSFAVVIWSDTQETIVDADEWIICTDNAVHCGLEWGIPMVLVIGQLESILGLLSC